jgi:alpha-1,2-mannosyltransferase
MAGTAIMAIGIDDTDRGAAPVVTSRIGAILAIGMLALYGLIGCIVALHIHHRLDPSGSPMFYDFSAFYQAGQFADSGRAAVAYDNGAMNAAVRAAFPGVVTRLPWSYPPTFQLLLMPLAALPYVMAWLVWSVVLYGLYALMARRLMPTRQLWVALVLPAAAINLLVGQNGLLSTILMGGGVLLLGKRPILGGALLGLMTYKPHFAVLVPLVLLCGREWRALAGAMASAAGAALLALAALGPAPWLAFAHKALQPAGVFTASSSAWRTVPSVQIMARTLGLDGPIGSALHWSVATAAAIGALWVWRGTTDARLRAGALAAATLLVTPYLRVYDLALLILPIAALVSRAGVRPSVAERVILVVAWVLPAVLLFAPPHIQIGPLATIALMGLILWRTARMDEHGRPVAAKSTMTLTLHTP